MGKDARRISKMTQIVRYLSRANYEARDLKGKFEGTFRWRWLASVWAGLHPERPMHTTRCTEALVPQVRAEVATLDHQVAA
jgi:hypothetical protein